MPDGRAIPLPHVATQNGGTALDEAEGDPEKTGPSDQASSYSEQAYRQEAKETSYSQAAAKTGRDTRYPACLWLSLRCFSHYRSPRDAPTEHA